MALLPFRVTALIFFFALNTQSVSAGIINGDFSTPLTDPNAGWETDSFFGDAPVLDAGRAKFEVEGDPASFNALQLQQQFLLPSDATSLSFEYLLSTQITGPTTTGPFDFFQASLFDPVTGIPLISIDPLTDPYYSIDAGGTELPASEVATPPELLSNGFTRVKVDVTAFQNREVLLEFYAFGDADDLTTTTLVDNVRISQNSVVVVPEPGAFFIWSFLALPMVGLTARRRIRSYADTSSSRRVKKRGDLRLSLC